MTRQTVKGPNGYDLAFVHIASGKEEQPLVVFLGGFRSDMNGSKAIFLEKQAKTKGFNYLRLDYGGHGASGGRFEDGSIKSWTEDARAVIDHVAAKDQPLILIGSSMGGWISYLLAEQMPERVEALISINPAPDFTDEFLQGMSAEQQRSYEENGYFSQPNAYSDEPYIFTKTLIEDSRKCFLLDKGIDYEGAVHILSGLEDDVVPPEKCERVAAAFASDRVTLEFIEGGDHSLSRPQDLEKLMDVLTRCFESVRS